MTDIEIIEKLGNVRCCLVSVNHKHTIDDTVEFIIAQQAEIDRLTKTNPMNMFVQIDDQTTKELLKRMKNKKIICIDDENIRAEAIKEFAEKLKEILNPFLNHDDCRFYTVKEKDINNLVKEMVGADNA